MKGYYLAIYSLLCILIISCGGSSGTPEGPPDDPAKPQLGKVLPDWSEGYLDIHAINTGRGECALYIFPDGTTMMVDAASASTDNEAEEDSGGATPIKPTGKEPVETVVNYISHFIEAASGKLDYIMLSHWHGDHIGGPPNAAMETHSSGKFILCGVTRIGTAFEVGKLIDRGRTYPKAVNSTGVQNYFRYVDWITEQGNTVREEAVVGPTTQVVMKVNPSAYSNFMVRNVCKNGYIWTGEGTDGSKNTFTTDPTELDKADENKFSIGFLMKYGKFDYFAGGDISYSGRSLVGAWIDIESSLATVMPQVEVMKAHHHGTQNCNSDDFLKAAKPDAVVAHVWQDVQPNPATVARMFSANKECNIFTTNMTDRNKGVLGAATVAKIKSTSGHIVVRVSPGGDQYYIYILNDNNEKYVVQRIFGPYECK